MNKTNNIEITADTITTAQIEALRTEAGAAGDSEMVVTCHIALNMPSLLPYGAPVEHKEMNVALRQKARDAREVCAEAINDAAARE